MGLQGAEHAMRHDPQLAASYAERFMNQYSVKMLTKSDMQLPHSTSSIKASYETESSKVKGESTISAGHNTHQNDLLNQANSAGVSPSSVIDHSLKAKTANTISNHKKEVHPYSVDAGGQRLADEVRNVITNPQKASAYSSMTPEQLLKKL